MTNKIQYNPKLKQLAKNLRKNSTLSEVLLWNQLKRKQFINLDFHRQKPIGNYIADFYCPELKLVIEIDGATHSDKLAYDEKRDREMKEIGLNILRFYDRDIKYNLPAVLEKIREWVEINSPLLRGDVVQEKYKIC